jgi:ubiquinone/menaquinone biosynthesis C-methylase UbiE
MNTKTHDYEKYAPEYASLGIEGTYYLGFRDIPELLKKHSKGKKALDYGCGAGRSTIYLKKLGYDAIGVDISNDMLAQARANDKNGEYHHIKSGSLPFEDERFDVVFSSYVFLEVSSTNEIKKILLEMKRVLKKDGIIVFVTSSMESPRGNWVSFSYDFPENKKTINSGDTVKLLIRGTNVILYDYYWTDDDYKKVFSGAGLRAIKIHKPLGYKSDSIEWLDEKRLPPMVVYILGNNNHVRRFFSIFLIMATGAVVAWQLLGRKLGQFFKFPPKR